MRNTSPPSEGCPQGGVENPSVGGCKPGWKIPLTICLTLKLIKNTILTTPKMKPEIVAYINDQPIFRRAIPILPANQALRSRCRALRKAGVLSEVIFWRQVRAGTFWKIDFDRQRIIGNFIVDFYVKSLGLIVEIDGSSHIGKEEYDARREAFLRSLGLDMYRISDLRVKHDLDNVMKELEIYIVDKYGK